MKEITFLYVLTWN